MQYATLSAFLEQSGYKRGTIDKTLFIKKDKKDIMLVQVYVDDIIFGSTKKYWCDKFEAFMKNRFQMSSIGELAFFFGLQVKQKEYGIFISQDKYVAEILKKFDLMSVKHASTPIETHKLLVKDERRTDCSKLLPKLHIFSVCERNLLCDYGGANLDRKSITGGCQFLGHRLISWQCKKQTIVATLTIEAEYVADANCCGQASKIHTDNNVADLLTKAFDVSSLYGIFCEQKDLDDGDAFHEVIWVIESNWREI
ncbi:putative ribonuclease H-like domain-containing protein [Tanacetum coccineum]